MKSLFDKDFKYTRASETDIRKTFARVRKEQEANKREAEQKVAQLNRSKKHG